MFTRPLSEMSDDARTTRPIHLQRGLSMHVLSRFKLGAKLAVLLDLSKQADQLSGEVKTFVAGVRAA